VELDEVKIRAAIVKHGMKHVGWASVSDVADELGVSEMELGRWPNFKELFESTNGLFDGHAIRPSKEGGYPPEVIPKELEILKSLLELQATFDICNADLLASKMGISVLSVKSAFSRLISQKIVKNIGKTYRLLFTPEDKIWVWTTNRRRDGRLTTLGEGREAGSPRTVIPLENISRESLKRAIEQNEAVIKVMQHQGDNLRCILNLLGPE